MKFFNRDEPNPIEEYNNLTGDKFTGTNEELKKLIDRELDRYAPFMSLKEHKGLKKLRNKLEKV